MRANPPLPVAQNVHRIGQPTWEEMHAVSLFFPPSVAGMPTVSTTRSSPRRRSNFAVPSAAAAMVCTDDRPTATFAAASSARMDLDNVVRSSMSRAGFAPYRWSRSCLPRNAGHPRSVAKDFSSGVVRPRRWKEEEGARTTAPAASGRERACVTTASS